VERGIEAVADALVAETGRVTITLHSPIIASNTHLNRKSVMSPYFSSSYFSSAVIVALSVQRVFTKRAREIEK
jgi:hypothetical protein